MQVTPTGKALGALVQGIDLRAPLTGEPLAAVRAAWLEHHVLVFPDQALTDDHLEAFTEAMGGFGDDPYIEPVPGRQHVIAVQRRADEQAPLFAGTWHTDWSFQAVPPAGTCLYGLTIPPVGGETSFMNQHLALEQMPDDLRGRIEGKVAVHSARAAYAPSGVHGDRAEEADRSMAIRYSKSAHAVQRHPLIRQHPETGRAGLFGCLGYIIGIDGMAHDEAKELLTTLVQWQSRPEFEYRHRWQPGMLVMWDNRSVLHHANGGYEGHDRLLHRTTIRDRVARGEALPA